MVGLTIYVRGRVHIYGTPRVSNNFPIMDDMTKIILYNYDGKI